MSTILGLSFGFHESAAAVVKNGKIIAAAGEERFSRKKNDASFPEKAICFCLEEANVEKPDLIVFYENPYLKMNRQISFAIEEKNIDYLLQCANNLKKEFDPIKQIANYFNIEPEAILLSEHHISHAASAFFASNYKEAAILVMDGVGEYLTASIYHGKDFELNRKWSISLPFSIGLIYTAFTYFLGFEVNEGEYKVMGMAGYGTPKYKNKIASCLTIDYEKDIYIADKELFEFKTPTSTHLRDKFYEIFGEARDSKAKFFLDESEIGQKNQYYADIAASLQSVVEDIIEAFAKKALKLCGLKTLCMAGGVALNSAANGKLRRNLDLEGFYIQPASSDAGNAVGAALFGASKHGELLLNREVMKYDIGKSYPEGDIVEALNGFMIDEYEHIEDEYSFADRTAELILQGKIIGWHYGCFEFGPRALGRRSILANPGHPDAKNIVNQKIKYRELFRPFAPSVMEEYASEWFMLPENLDKNAPEKFMLAVAQVRDEKKSTIPAVTHIDGTARVHLVGKDGVLYRKLLEKMHEKSGIPILLNTSFNLKGEPIVSSPGDAFRTFVQCGIDVLAIYPYLIFKSDSLGREINNAM